MSTDPISEDHPLLLRQFLSYLHYERHYSAHTRAAYTRDLQQFADFCNAHYSLAVLAEAEHLANLRPLHVRSYIATLDAKRSTLNRKLSAVRSFLKYHQRIETIEEAPVLRIKLPKTPKRVPVAVPEAELSAVLDEMRSAAGDFVSARNWLMLELLYGCGLRRQELIDLQWQHIDRNARCIKTKGKGNKTRVIPYNTTVEAALENYLAHLPPRYAGYGLAVLLTQKWQPVYPKLVYRVVQNVLKQVPGLSKSSPHVLRHSFATHLLDHDANLNTVKELLGHNSLASTQIYVHASVARLKSVHKQAHPKS